MLGRAIKWPIKWWFHSQRGSALNQRLLNLLYASEDIQLRRSLGSCGTNVTIQRPVCFAQPHMIHVGDDVSFAAYVHIWGAGGLRIGNRVLIGSHSAITTVTHDYNADPVWGTVMTKPVIIEDDVWVGTHAVILPGVRVGRGAVIAAGAVITKDVPPRAIVCGVPGRLLKYRAGDGEGLQPDL